MACSPSSPPWPEPRHHEIRERLRALRHGRDLTQSDPASRSGLAPDSITYLERRQTPPRRTTMQRLADALEVSATTLTRTGISPDEPMPALLRDLAQPGSRWSVEEQGARLAEAHAHLRLIYGDECHEATSEPG